MNTQRLAAAAAKLPRLAVVDSAGIDSAAGDGATTDLAAIEVGVPGSPATQTRRPAA